MKTGDWLKVSIFALVGVIISLVILGFNSNTNKNAARNAYNNYPYMQGYANTGFYPDNQPKARQTSQKNEYRNSMQMQGDNGFSAINGTTMDYSQTGYLPSQLMAMNYQMINNDRYLQNEITSIKQHGARLHNEVQELQSQYGQLKQGLSNVYTTLNGLNQNNPAQNAGMSYGGKGMQMIGSGYDAPAQYQKTGMGMNGMGTMNPVQNQYGMGYTTPNQYQPTGMNGNNQMSQPGTIGMNSMQNQGMNMMNQGMNMGMGMMDNMMMDNMMMNMMNMMDKMMMMNGMQNSGNGMSSGNSGSGGSMSSGSGSSGGGMGMM